MIKRIVCTITTLAILLSLAACTNRGNNLYGSSMAPNNPVSPTTAPTEPTTGIMPPIGENPPATPEQGITPPIGENPPITPEQGITPPIGENPPIPPEGVNPARDGLY